MTLVLGAVLGAVLALAGGIPRQIWTDHREARAVARTLKLELEGNFQQLEIEESLPHQAHLRMAEPQEPRRTAWEVNGVAVMRVASQRRADSIARAYLGQARYREAADGKTDVTFGHLEASFVNTGIQALQPLTERWRLGRQFLSLGQPRHPAWEPPQFSPYYVSGVTVVPWQWRFPVAPSLFFFMPPRGSRGQPSDPSEPTWRRYVFPYDPSFSDHFYPLAVADVPVLGPLVSGTRQAWRWLREL